jgi:hypothetical protein
MPMVPKSESLPGWLPRSRRTDMLRGVARAMPGGRDDVLAGEPAVEKSETITQA